MTDLRHHLTGIYRRTGQLTAAAVVDDARPPGSPLHDRFEWDDAVAGEKYRISQAAQLIRSVRIEFSEPGSDQPKFVRAFSSLHEMRDPERCGYAPTDEIVSDEMSRRILLRQMERDIADLKRRYSHLQEFAEFMGREFGAAS